MKNEHRERAGKQSGSIPVLLINLVRSTDRLRIMSMALAERGVQFKRVVAVDGNTINLDERGAWCEARSFAGHADWLNGQIGCFLSHELAWRKMLEHGHEVAIILEDDVHVSNDLGSVCGNRDWIPDEADVVRLEATPFSTKLRGSYKVPGTARDVSLSEGVAWGTGGYLIRSDVARWLLSSPPRRHLPIDQFLFNRDRSVVSRGLTVYQMHPAIVVQDKYVFDVKLRTGAGSLIDGPEVIQQERGLLQRAVHALARCARGRQLVRFKA